jgi:hypothetical protein
MGPGSKIESERGLFEIDRKALLREVQTLLSTILNTSTEIAMVAAENVFDRRTSSALKRNAGALHRTAQRLEAMGVAVARAKIGGAKTPRGRPRKPARR